MAKDQATREAWWEDNTFLSPLNASQRRQYSKMDFQVCQDGLNIKVPDQYFNEELLFYRHPSCPYAFYHRAVKVKR